MSKRISFVTLGCAKNEVDTNHMQEALLQAGYDVVSPEEDVDAVIVNTCSFIQEAVEESLDTIFDIAHQEAIESGRTKLVVAGCLPSRYGDDLGVELTEPDRFVPCQQEEHIVRILDELFDEVSTPTEGKVVVAAPPTAYVKISDGCDRYCYYCTIPYIRGRYHSFSFESIDAEVDGLVEAGVKEIVLIAQDTGFWGQDFTPRDSLPLLLKRLARKHPSVWFRIMYVQPNGINDQLLSVMEDHDNICPYLDIPLQHCNPKLLRAMNRSGSRERFLALIAQIRQRLTGVALRTTFIVGYPGETEEDFEELCGFVQEAEFDYVGIFPYSAEEGTRAANLPNQVPEEVKMERFQRLRDLADSVSTQRIRERIGEHTKVLVLGVEEDGQLFGRTMTQAPDVDGVTFINDGEIGEFINVEIEDTLMYEMEAVRE